MTARTRAPYRTTMAGRPVLPGAVVQVPPHGTPHCVTLSAPPTPVIYNQNLEYGSLWVVRGPCPERLRQHLDWPLSSVELVSPVTGLVVAVHGAFKGAHHFAVISDGLDKP